MRTTTHPTRAGGLRAAVGGSGVVRRDGRGFTIVEATIVIAIIALLASIVLYAVGLVRKKGDIVAEVAMVEALQKSVEKFKQDFNFLPPLVVDTGAGPTGLVGPIANPGNQIVIWDVSNLSDPNTTLNGTTPVLNNRYSVYSLPYYLVGALDVSYDGGAGLTFTAPGRDGQFTKRGRTYDAFLDLTQQKTRLGATRLFIKNNTDPIPSMRIICKIWDRWSGGADDSTSYPIRYYRWLPQYFPAGDPKAGQVQYWNIPIEIGGNPNNMLPPLNADLKSAEYAIVSPGPDHWFGDEISFLTTPELRAKAAADNIIQVGR
jgi:type II secretory pathway pseudopilin PulG